MWCLGCQVKPEKIFETLTFFCPGDIRKGAVTQRGPEADSQTVMNAKRAVCVFYVCECDYVILKQVQWLRIGAASFSVSYVWFSHIPLTLVITCLSPPLPAAGDGLGMKVEIKRSSEVFPFQKHPPLRQLPDPPLSYLGGL